MEERLQQNFLEIQAKINSIFASGELHIKQIADLERYVLMQKHIVESMLVAKKVAER